MLRPFAMYSSLSFEREARERPCICSVVNTVGSVLLISLNRKRPSSVSVGSAVSTDAVRGGGGLEDAGGSIGLGRDGSVNELATSVSGDLLSSSSVIPVLRIAGDILGKSLSSISVSR